MPLKEDSQLDSVSKALASFSKVTVCNLHRVITKCEMNFNHAKFIFPCK